ncbi:MAG TPA: sterol desaturase family protein [Rhizomicrobium sp.]
MFEGGLRKSWPYAAGLGFLLAAGGLFILLEPHIAPDLWQRGSTYAGAHWRRFLFGPGGRMILMLAALMIMEVFFLEWQKTSICSIFFRRSRSSKADAAWAFLYFAHLQFFVETALTLGAAFGLSKLIGAGYTHLGWQRFEMPFHGPLAMAATFVVFFLVSTFVAYWSHRLEHWRYFWHLHRYHHSATELNVLSGFRSNPVESLVNALGLPLPLILLRMDDWTVIGLVMAYQSIATLQHSELRWNFGWFGRWVIVSPQMHQIHHSIDAEHKDRNFGVCPLWDHLFGTWYSGPNLPSGYGIPDPSHIERPVVQWLFDVWAFYRDAALWLRGLAGLGRSAPALPPEPASPAGASHS